MEAARFLALGIFVAGCGAASSMPVEREDVVPTTVNEEPPDLVSMLDNLDNEEPPPDLVALIESLDEPVTFSDEPILEMQLPRGDPEELDHCARGAWDIYRDQHDWQARTEFLESCRRNQERRALREK